MSRPARALRYPGVMVGPRVGAGALWLVLLPLASAPSVAGAEAETPAACQRAIEAASSPAVGELAALAKAEQALWRRARNAEREARLLMRSSVGLGESRQTFRGAAKVEELGRVFEQSIMEARVLCGCRQQRGDADRSHCDWQYRRWIAPSRAGPRDPAAPGPDEDET